MEAIDLISEILKKTQEFCELTDKKANANAEMITKIGETLIDVMKAFNNLNERVKTLEKVVSTNCNG